MPEVHLHPVVPIFDGDAFNAMAIIVSGVVDQHPHRTVAILCLGNGAPQRLDIGQITVNEMRRRLDGPGQPSDERQRGLPGDIDKTDLGALPREMFNQTFADATAAAADKHASASKARIVCGLFDGAVHRENQSPSGYRSSVQLCVNVNRRHQDRRHQDVAHAAH